MTPEAVDMGMRGLDVVKHVGESGGADIERVECLKERRSCMSRTLSSFKFKLHGGGCWQSLPPQISPPRTLRVDEQPGTRLVCLLSQFTTVPE